MKITVQKLVEQEIEMPEFPFYLKRVYSVYKIINEDNCVSVNDYCEPSIECQGHTVVALKEFENSEIITKEEFKEFYNMVLTKIEEKL